MNICSLIIESSMSISQFGVRPGRGSTDAIFITGQLIEKLKEHQHRSISTLLILKAELYTIWREEFWKMHLKIGIPNKLVKMIKNLYDKSECSIIAGREQTD